MEHNYTPLPSTQSFSKKTIIFVCIFLLILSGLAGWFFYNEYQSIQLQKEQFANELDAKALAIKAELKEEQDSAFNTKFEDLTKVIKALIGENQETEIDPYILSNNPSGNTYLHITPDNLIRNSSFESGENNKPRQWHYILDSTSSNTYQSNEAIRSGKFGLKFEGHRSTGESGVQLGISQPVTKTVPGRTYTLSLYVKTVNVEEGATLRIGFWDEYANRYAYMDEVVLYPNLEWYRISTKTSTDGLITDWANWYPIIEVRNHKGGAVYIDDVQLTEGDTVIDYSSALAGNSNSNVTSTIGNGSVLVTATGSMYPAEDGVGSLGTSSNSWHDLYLVNATITENGDMNLHGDLSVGDDLTVNGTSTFANNVTFQGTTVFSGTPDFTGGISVGEDNAFTINSSGNITKINNLAYSFPTIQGASNEILINDGNGNLSWGTFGAASVASDSLDFEQLKDALTLDDDTSIDVYDGTIGNDIRIYNSNSLAEILFVEGSTGSIGIANTNPTYALDVAGGIRIGGTAVFSSVNSIGDTNTVLTLSSGVLSAINTGGWDKTTSDDLTTITNFGGDVSGTYNALEIGATTITETELASTGVNAGTYGTTAGTAAYIPRLSIDQDGRITSASTVAFTLDFESPLTFSNGLTRTANNIQIGGSIIADTRLNIGNTEVFYIDASLGTVGIGTVSPTEKLTVVGNISASGSVTGSSFSGSGSSLTALNASQLTTGTVPSARISGSYTGITGTGALNAGSITNGFGNIDIGGTFSGNGSGLTNLNATQLTTGTLPDARLTGSYTGLTNLTGSGIATFGSFTGVGSSLTALNATQLTTGTVPSARISGSYTGITGTGALNAGSITNGFGNIDIGGTFSGNGSGLTNLNASNLSAGTVADGRISGSYTGLTNLTGSGTATFGTFSGSGASLTSLNATQLTTGTLPDARLTGSYTGLTNLTGSGIATFGSFTGVGSSLTALNASQLTTGTVPSARISGSYTGITGTGALNAGSITSGFGNIDIGGTFSGNGSGLTNLNASNLSAGTVADGRISGSYTGLTNLTGSGTATFGTFSGSGASLTSLNATQLTTGTLPDARLTGAYTGLTNLTGSGTATFGTFSGSGASLTSLNASNLSTGTVADARITGAYTGITNLSMTGTLTLSQNAADTINFSASSTNDARGLSFNARTALSSDSSDGWLRLNQDSEFTSGVYTPGGLRADGGLAAASYTLTSGEVRANVFRDGNSSYYLQPADTGTAGILAGDFTIGGTENPFSRVTINSTTSRGLTITSGSSWTGLTVYTNGDQGLFYSANGSVYCSINAINALMECASDARLKKEVQTSNYGLNAVSQLRGVDFKWKDPTLGDAQHLGFIAQEVEKIIPELVSTNKDGIKSVGYSNFAPILVNAINEQQDIINRNYNSLALADAKTSSRINTLSSNITGKQTDILGLKNNVTSLDQEIESYANDIHTLQAQMDKVFDIINKKQVATQEANIASLTERVSFLEKLLGAQTVSASTTEKTATEEASISKEVLENLTVTGKTNLYDLGVVGDISAGQIVINGKDSQINSLALPLEIQSDSTNPVEIMGGKVTIETNGNLHIKQEITAKKYNVDESEKESASIGEATLKAGETEIIIETSSVTESSKIFLTPTKETELQLAVVEKERGKSFKVKVVKEAEEDISFNWWIVN